MSFYLAPILVCDWCGWRFEAGERIPSIDGKTRHNAAKVRAEAKSEGWSSRRGRLDDGLSDHRGRRDFCPRCTKLRTWERAEQQQQESSHE